MPDVPQADREPEVVVTIQRHRMADNDGVSFGIADPDGAWVTYADHVEALRQAEQRGRDTRDDTWDTAEAYRMGQRDALANREYDWRDPVLLDELDRCIALAHKEWADEVVQRVEALKVWASLYRQDIDYTIQAVDPAEVIAAIKEGSDETH